MIDQLVYSPGNAAAPATVSLNEFPVEHIQKKVAFGYSQKRII
jgi:hypothetical protein